MRVELRLTLVAAAATVLGTFVFSPVFDGDWGPRVIAAPVLVAAVGLVVRALLLRARAAVAGGVTVVAQVIAVLCLITGLFAPASGVLRVLPGPGTPGALAAVVRSGIADIARYAVPVSPPTPGLLLLAVGGVGLVAVLVDLAAVSLRVPALAGVPLLLLFAVPAFVVPSGIGVGWFVLSAAGWLGLLIADGRRRLDRWSRTGVRRDPRRPAARTDGAPGAGALAARGWQLSAVALVLAALVPVLAPGLTTGWAGSTSSSSEGGSATVTVLNPMASLQRNLNQPEDRVVITYRTDDPNPEYLRLVTLDTFDGTRWERAGFPTPTANRIDGQVLPLPAGLGSDVPRTLHQSRFQVLDEADSWLATPYPPSRVTVYSGGDWRYDSQTLNIVGRGGATTQGISYSVASYELAPTAAQLRAAPAASGDALRYTSLPSGLPQQLYTMARQATAGRTNAYDRALALQRYFQDTSIWSYSTNIQASGSDRDALRTFLTDKNGYCQQYAATMALMARSLGIPARVDVGFTAGTASSNGDYEVTLHDAHAWPELYFPGVGWIRFEPTPRADGQAQEPAYAPPAAATGGDEAVPSNRPSATPQPSAGAQASASATPTPSAAAGAAGSGGGGAARAALDAGRVVLGLAVVALLALPGVVRAVVRRRRLSASGTAEDAWSEVLDTAEDLGHRVDPAATVRTAAAGLGAVAPAAAQDLVRLGRRVELERYAGGPAPTRTAVGSQRQTAADEAVAARAGLVAASTRWWRVLAVVAPVTTVQWGRAAARRAQIRVESRARGALRVLTTHGRSAGGRRGADARV